MTRTRFPHPQPSPTLTAGDDQPIGRCADDYWPFDQMTDHKPGSANHEAARRLASAVCQSCPLTRCGYRIGRANAA